MTGTCLEVIETGTLYSITPVHAYPLLDCLLISYFCITMIRDARYSRYYRDDIPPSHRYSPSSSMFPPRDYPKSASSSSRNDCKCDPLLYYQFVFTYTIIVNSDRSKDGKEDMRTSNTSSNTSSSNNNNNNNDSYTPSSTTTTSTSRYGNNDWHRDRRYRSEDEYRWDMRRER